MEWTAGRVGSDEAGGVEEVVGEGVEEKWRTGWKEK